MKNWLVAIVLLALSGCATMVKVESGHARWAAAAGDAG